MTNYLYGWAMKQLLPVGGFQWVNPELDEALNQIKVEYGDNACLLYTDTDCLLFQVQTEDVDMRKSAEKYDFSDYPKYHLSLIHISEPTRPY